PRDDPDRSLAELLLVGRNDRGDLVARGRVVRRYDDDELRRLAHHPAALLVPPLAGRIENAQAVRKARRDLAGEKARPCRLADADAAADIAAEHQLDLLHGLLRRAAGGSLGSPWRWCECGGRDQCADDVCAAIPVAPANAKISQHRGSRSEPAGS